MLTSMLSPASLQASELLATVQWPGIGSLLPLLQQHIRPFASSVPHQQHVAVSEGSSSVNKHKQRGRLQHSGNAVKCSQCISTAGVTGHGHGHRWQHTSAVTHAEYQQQNTDTPSLQYDIPQKDGPIRAAQRLSQPHPGPHRRLVGRNQPAQQQQQQQQQQHTAVEHSRSSNVNLGAAGSTGPLHQQQQQQPGMAVPQHVQQAPNAPGSPARPMQRTPHFTARHHLQQYLASINNMGFVDDLAEGIWAGNRSAISRSLTLCESTRPDHALQAAALLRRLIDNNHQRRLGQQQVLELQQISELQPQANSSQSAALGPGLGMHQQLQQLAQLPGAAPHPQAQQQTIAAQAAPVSSSPMVQHGILGGSLRVGLSGPPGAGKSSLIETWGCYLADHGSKVAVLAVDPSSVETGGAILGDKTRMARLSSHPNAFVRPSPARGTLGGVSRATYDAMVICEAAGYDKVLVETVGVGQSEVAVADLVDCMVLVMPPVGGDDLQMIKRGIMEVADVVLVNKADGPTEAAATRAAAEYAGCLHLMPHRYRCWEPQVLPVSAHSGRGVPALARLVADFQKALTESGELDKCRTRRAEAITWLNLEEQLLEGLRHDVHVRWLMARLMPWVRSGQMAPRSAADIALSYFYQHCT